MSICSLRPHGHSKSAGGTLALSSPVLIARNKKLHKQVLQVRKFRKLPCGR